MKVRDRVRCTLGDSVLVGTVRRMHGVLVEIEVVVEGTTSVFSLGPEWHIEILAPALPPEPPEGSVVRCADQDGTTAFVRDGKWWLRTGSESAWTREGLLAAYGPITLLIPATQVIEDVREAGAAGDYDDCHVIADRLAEKYGVRP